MKTTKLFFMAALALTFAACSNDDNDFENPGKHCSVTHAKLDPDELMETDELTQMYRNALGL